MRVTRAPQQPLFPGRDASEEFEGSPDGCSPSGALAPCPPPVLACQGEPIRPGPSGFSDPGGSCIEACFASRPGHGDLTRLPVATDLLDGAPSLPATSMPRRLLSARLGISDVSRTPSCADVVTIRPLATPGDNVAGVVQLGFASGLFWCGSFGTRGAQPGRIARDVHRLSSRPKCEARRAGTHRETSRSRNGSRIALRASGMTIRVCSTSAAPVKSRGCPLRLAAAPRSTSPDFVGGGKRPAPILLQVRSAWGRWIGAKRRDGGGSRRTRLTHSRRSRSNESCLPSPVIQPYQAA